MGVDTYIVCHACKQKTFIAKEFKKIFTDDARNVLYFIESHRDSSCKIDTDDDYSWSDKVLNYKNVYAPNGCVEEK